MFNEKLKKIREEKKISQVDFAKRIGIPVSTYRNYENTTRQPSFDILLEISSQLNVSVDTLLGNKDKICVREDVLCKLKALDNNDLNEIKNYIDYLEYRKKKAEN